MREPSKRRCGDCTLCCTVMGVVDLDPDGKLPGDRCPHECSRGCRIYADRPATCRAFECVWLQGLFPTYLRPDKAGILFVMGPNDLLVGFIDPKRPERWKRTTREALTRIGEPGGRSVVGPPGGKPTHQFDVTGELLRPPEADAGVTYVMVPEGDEFVVYCDQGGERTEVDRGPSARYAVRVLQKLEEEQAQTLQGS